MRARLIHCTHDVLTPGTSTNAETRLDNLWWWGTGFAPQPPKKERNLKYSYFSRNYYKNSYKLKTISHIVTKYFAGGSQNLKRACLGLDSEACVRSILP